MPFVMIHMSSDTNTYDKSLLAKEVREAVVSELKISKHIGQVMLYETPRKNRSIHESRNIDFVFVEIIIYSGRSAEMKQGLMEKIAALICKHIGVNKEDINCCIVEVPKENWYGGVSHKYIKDIM